MQQARSYYLNKVVKTDLWDTRHKFRNAIKHAIYKANLGLDTMEEVEDAVVQYMKQWVKEAD